MLPAPCSVWVKPDETKRIRSKKTCVKTAQIFISSRALVPQVQASLLVVELQLQPQQATLLTVAWFSAVFEGAIAVLVLNGRFKVFAKFDFDSEVSLAHKVLSRIEFLLLSAAIVLETKIRIDGYVAGKRLPVVQQRVSSVESFLIDVFRRRVVLRPSAPVVLHLKPQKAADR